MAHNPPIAPPKNPHQVIHQLCLPGQPGQSSARITVVAPQFKMLILADKPLTLGVAAAKLGGCDEKCGHDEALELRYGVLAC